MAGPARRRRRPFQLDVANGRLTFAPHDNVVQAHINDVVFVDFERLLAYQPVLRVAMLLEELVDVLMAVEDEVFVMKVVAALLPEVRLENGRYAASANDC